MRAASDLMASVCRGQPAPRRWRGVLLGLIGGLSLLLGACTTAEAPFDPTVEALPRLQGSFVRGADGRPLSLRAWLPADETPEAVIVALHGFNDHAGAFRDSGPTLAARGLGVYAYDQRGFGLSPGRGEWPGSDALVADAHSVIAAVHARHPDVPLILMGESMGGAVAIAAATDPDAPPLDDLSAVVLVAPAVWARKTMPWYYRAVLWVVSRVAPGLELTGSDLEIWPSDNLSMLRGLGTDRLMIRGTRVDALAGLTDLMDLAYSRAGSLERPSLVLYGLNDEIIPAGPVRTVAKRVQGPQHRIALYPEGWHMMLRDVEGPLVLNDIAAWLKDRDAPLPSGADRRANAFRLGTLESAQERGDDPDPVALWKARLRASAEAPGQ